MSLLVILLLSGLVSVLSQSTLLDSQCDDHCRNIEIRRLVAMMENMNRDTLFLKDTNEISQKMITELETKLYSQKTSYDTEVSILNSQLSDQENKFENRVQELNQKVKNQKNTINQLQTKVSELESKIQTIDVERSTISGVGNTTNDIESTTPDHPSVIENSTCEDCEDIRALGYQTSGMYGVNAGNGLIKHVFCEMSADSGAWTRILHRQDNLTDFTYKKWADYEAGFGDPRGSHWMGLVQMHNLTTSREYKLRVDLMDWEGETRFAEYSIFHVGPGWDKYRLTISGYSGTAGDSMNWYHNNMLFTTFDSDNDMSSAHCAVGTAQYTGGWWYNWCFNARLTGTYLEGGDRVPYEHGIVWKDWRGYYYSYKVATMKVQRL